MEKSIAKNKIKNRGSYELRRLHAQEGHDKDGVTWDELPDVTNPNFADGIPWFGTCECGLRVYEFYRQEDELKEA